MTRNFRQSFIFAHFVLTIDTLTWSTIGSTCSQRHVIELTLRGQQAARCRSSRRPKVSSINKRLQSDGYCRNYLRWLCYRTCWLSPRALAPLNLFCCCSTGDWNGGLRSKDAEAWHSDGGQRRQPPNDVPVGVIVFGMT